MKRVFQYRDYRKFLNDKAKEFGRGFATRLAGSLRVQTSFISQVMAGTVGFSPEHAIAVARHLQLGERETEFLHLLVMRDRSGTPELSAYYDGKIEKLAALDREVKAHLQPSAQLSEELKAIYYSSWKYQAIHVGSSIPALANIPALADHLKLSMDEVRRIVDELIEWGLVSETDGVLCNLQVSVHLPRNHYLTPNYHLNWRLRALLDLDDADARRVHFSSTVSLSRVDAGKIRDILLASLRAQDDLIASSKEEELWHMNLDWFALGRGKDQK